MHPHVHYIPEGTVIRWTEAIKTSIRLQHEDEATEISEFLYCFTSVNFSSPSVSYNMFIVSAQCNSVQSLTCVQLFVTPWTVSHQAPFSMEFSKQEYWSWFQFLFQGIFPTQGLNPCLLHLCEQVDSLPLYHLGIPQLVTRMDVIVCLQNSYIEALTPNMMKFEVGMLRSN